MQKNSQAAIEIASGSGKLAFNYLELLVDAEFRLIKVALDTLRTENNLIDEKKAVTPLIPSFPNCSVTEAQRAMMQNYVEGFGRYFGTLFELQDALGQETQKAARIGLDRCSDLVKPAKTTK